MGNKAEAEDISQVQRLWTAYPHTMAPKASKGRWIAYDWLRYLSILLVEAIMEGNQKIIIEAPPQHGKSELVSHWLVVWFLENFPEKRVILASYAEGFASKWGARVRDEFMNTDPEYEYRLTTKVHRDHQASGDWWTVDGGGMLCVGLQGGATGNPAELLIIDDPFKNFEEAMSEVIREKIYNTYFSDFKTRVQAGGTQIVFMTRRHEDDLIGRLKATDDTWRVITLPALAEPGDAMGRAPGEALCRERFDEALLTNWRAKMPKLIWNALYQQRPSAMEGNLYKRQNWRHWDERTRPVKFDDSLISVDTNVEEGADNDFTVIQAWGKLGANFYLLDQVRGQWGMSDQLAQFELFCKRFPTIHRKLIEKKANGPAIQNLLKKRIGGIILVEPQGSKYERAMATEPYQTGGNIFLPADDDRFPWVEDFKAEHANFPRGKNDDQVDTQTQAIIHWCGSATDFFDKINKQ